MRLELVCLKHSILLCNVAFFYSFSNFPKLFKKTKKSNIPQKEEGKSIFLLCFFRLSKHEKSPIFPSLGSLNLHRRTLPLCVLSTALASSTHQPSNNFLLRLNTFGHWRIFPEYHFLEHQSCPYALTLYVCCARSSTVT